MDPRHLEHGHNPRDIAKRLKQGPHISYLRDWVYGGIDGTVIRFAVVAGVVGADLSRRAPLETFLIGTTAAAVAYLVGLVLGRLV